MNVIYIRVSTERQDEKQQLPSILKKFNLKKEDCLIMSDKISAYNEKKEDKRLSFLDLKKLISENKISKLYVWDTDRIYRNYNKFKEFFLLCKKTNTEIYSVRQDFLNSFNTIEGSFKEVIKDIFISFLGWVAEEESSKKSERVKLKIDKSNQITKSTYGKKWGRKRKVKLDKVLDLKKENPNITISEIARQLDINKGSVAYILNNYNKVIENSKEK
jgi:DNA invertase Pin-like site-specific DNA recombinase